MSLTLTSVALKSDGYRVSAQVSDEQVAKAQREAVTCYVSRVITPIDDTDADVVAAIKQLTFVILAKRDTIVTRAGGKDKSSPTSSVDAQLRQVDIEEADRLLRVLQGKPNGIPGTTSKLVEDIAHIYFRTEYINL